MAWSRAFLHSRYARHTIIDGNTIFVTSDSLFCLNLADGKTIWRAEYDDAQIVPVVDDVNVDTLRNKK